MWRALFSPGIAVIAALCVVSSLLVAFRPGPPRNGSALWVFNRTHYTLYVRLLADWNARHPENAVRASVIDFAALERRLLSGFLSGTPVAELVETERGMIGRTFLGPLEAVGFTDLTDLLREEGLDEEINPPSFSPWTSRGRVFGIPHDVHPVMLAYRADLIEAAGIDLTQAATWDDLERLLRPLQRDLDGDGRLDRYAMSFWHLDAQTLETLVLQADGTLFDEQDRPTLDSARNAWVLSRLALWIGGPRRMAMDAPNFSAAGSQLRLQGNVLCTIMPDWLAGVWMNEQRGLAGKVKLMPLPAWEPGGRRTSVMGGTMLGIPKTVPDFTATWAIAKHLYLSPELARALFQNNAIISPVKSLWNQPFYDEPNPFFQGQRIGRMFIELAPHVPRRSSSPYSRQAATELSETLRLLSRRAEEQGVADPAELEPLARELLGAAQQRILVALSRNVFLNRPAAPAPAN